MAHHTKEHRATIRYSLFPEETRIIVDYLLKKGHMPQITLKSFAERFNCAQKTIHQVVTRHGCKVIEATPEDTTHEKLSPKTTSEHEASDLPSAVQSSLENEVDPLDALIAIEAELKARHEEREASILDAANDIEHTLAEREEDLNQQRERVRAAIQQTRDMRLATRADRVLMEDLRGENTTLKLRTKRAERLKDQIEAENALLRAELLASVEREQGVLTALLKSEEDLQRCRSRFQSQPEK
jgi:Ulp1 family protease